MYLLLRLNLGSISEKKGNFVNYWLLLKTLFHICDIYHWNYLPHTIFCFHLIDFQLYTDFLSQFCTYVVKSPKVTQRSGSHQHESEYEKSKTLSVFLWVKWRMFCKLRHYVFGHILYSLYCTLVLPYVNYGIRIWRNIYKVYF